MGKFTTWASEFDKAWTGAAKSCFKMNRRRRFSLTYQMFAFTFGLFAFLLVSLVIVPMYLFMGLALLVQHKSEKQIEA